MDGLGGCTSQQFRDVRWLTFVRLIPTRWTKIWSNKDQILSGVLVIIVHEMRKSWPAFTPANGFVCTGVRHPCFVCSQTAKPTGSMTKTGKERRKVNDVWINSTSKTHEQDTHHSTIEHCWTMWIRNPHYNPNCCRGTRQIHILFLKVACLP